MSTYDNSLPKEVRQTTQDIAEGATKGFLNWSKEQLKFLAEKFRNKELAFIQDEETINLVKEQLKSGEWSLFNRYIKNKELKMLIIMGLTLRSLEKQKKQTAIKNLRDKIVVKYKRKGLHISQFVQCSLLNEYVGGIVDKASSETELIHNIEEMLSNLETRSSFLKTEDIPEIKIEEILTRIRAHSPDNYIIFARNSALSAGSKVKELLGTKIKDYNYDLRVTKTNNSLLIIISKKELNNYI